MRPDCNLDLRSLRFFLSLYKTSSFAKTGHEFGMSPATVQRTIDKLREAFEDKLFERRGLVMVPTAKARRIATELSGAMAALERVGEGSDDFADRSVVMRISTFDNATIAVLVPGVEGVRAKAPNIRWQFLQADEHMFDHLRNGNNDFALPTRRHGFLYGSRRHGGIEPTPCRRNLEHLRLGSACEGASNLETVLVGCRCRSRN